MPTGVRNSADNIFILLETKPKGTWNSAPKTSPKVAAVIPEPTLPPASKVESKLSSDS